MKEYQIILDLDLDYIKEYHNKSYFQRLYDSLCRNYYLIKQFKQDKNIQNFRYFKNVFIPQQINQFNKEINKSNNKIIKKIIKIKHSAPLSERVKLQSDENRLEIINQALKKHQIITLKSKIYETKFQVLGKQYCFDEKKNKPLNQKNHLIKKNMTFSKINRLVVKNQFVFKVQKPSQQQFLESKQNSLLKNENNLLDYIKAENKGKFKVITQRKIQNLLLIKSKQRRLKVKSNLDWPDKHVKKSYLFSQRQQQSETNRNFYEKIIACESKINSKCQETHIKKINQSKKTYSDFQSKTYPILKLQKLRLSQNINFHYKSLNLLNNSKSISIKDYNLKKNRIVQSEPHSLILESVNQFNNNSQTISFCVNKFD